MIVEDGDTGRLVRALDMGVNDYLLRPVERNELVARARSQLRRKRYQDYLRDKFQQGLELAITDGLTGLHNRRYMEGHLSTLVTDAANTGKPVSLLIFDIDHFKPVNDTYGHAAGDAVLKQFADRIANNVRGVDLACRLGGEEFVVVMPDHGYRLCDRGCRTAPAVHRGEALPSRRWRAGTRRDGEHRHRGDERAERHGGEAHGARRPGALPREAGRAEPRRGRSGLIFSKSSETCGQSIGQSSRVFDFANGR